MTMDKKRTDTKCQRNRRIAGYTMNNLLNEMAKAWCKYLQAMKR